MLTVVTVVHLNYTYSKYRSIQIPKYGSIITNSCLFTIPSVSTIYNNSKYNKLLIIYCIGNANKYYMCNCNKIIKVNIHNNIFIYNHIKYYLKLRPIYKNCHLVYYCQKYEIICPDIDDRVDYLKDTHIFNNLIDLLK